MYLPGNLPTEWIRDRLVCAPASAALVPEAVFHETGKPEMAITAQKAVDIIRVRQTPTRQKGRA
jgi:hypothetical protein